MSYALSKSRYTCAVQCPKMLWLKMRKPEEFDQSVLNEEVLRTGNEVGDLAMGLFGEYREVPFGDKDLEGMIRTTKEWIGEGVPVIAEASFSFDGCFCSVDILKNSGGGRVEVYEVKSSTHVREIYYHDAAFQLYVLTGLGYEVERVCIVHVDSSYVRRGEIDLDGLFAVEDVTERVRGMQEEVAERIREIRNCLELPEEPKEPGIRPACFDPYDCGFWKYCTRDLPHPNVFDLSSLQKRSKFKLYDAGIVSYPQLETNGKLKPDPLLQVRQELYDLPPKIDRGAVAKFLNTLSWPLYFLDFESFQPAVPLFDESSPYEQIPFQYSLHVLESEDAELLHREYLAEPEGDPRRGVAESLCRDIPADVCVVAYNMSFEKNRIRRLAELYPDLSGHLMAIHDHVVDLMVPFQKKAFYCRAMQGSHSIKYVLPALYPDDPKLDYHNLEGVHNGTEASDAFSRMRDMDPKERGACRAELLKYCGLDTYAMVKVWEKLRENVL